MTAQTKPLQVTVGCTLRVVKGLRNAHLGKRTGTINAGEHWKVESIGRPDAGLSLVLSRGEDRVRMHTSAAGKTAQPEFNLNTGDPTRNIRVRITHRPTEEIPMATETNTEIIDGDSLFAAWTDIRIAAAAFDEDGERGATDAQIAMIEPGVQLLELSLKYNVAHVEWVDAKAQAEEALGKSRRVWDLAKARLEVAQASLEAAQGALLNAARAAALTVTRE